MSDTSEPTSVTIPTRWVFVDGKWVEEGLPVGLPPRSYTWEQDFQYYIERARVAEHIGHYARASACAAIAQALATGKLGSAS